MFRGNLSRKELANNTGIDRQHFTKNTTIAKMLNELEDRLREANILPKLTEQGKAEQKCSTLDRNSIKQAQEQSRIPKLEQRILELEAENNAIKGRLGRFSEIVDVYNDLDEL